MSRFWPLLLMTVSLLAGCAGGDRGKRPDDSSAEIYDITAEASAWADSVCSVLDMRSKVAQLFMPAVYASADEFTLRKLRDYAEAGVGGIVLLKGDIGGAARVADSISLNSAVRPFVAIDAEWGLAMRLADAPRFPSNSKIGPAADEQTMYDYGREVARESRLLGINMVLGPVVDVSGPDSFMLYRSFGDDPLRVADLSVAYARGLEDGDVISVAKHFPGHGSVSSDSHKIKGVISKSLNEMDSVDLYPFRRWVEQRLSAIMVGHLAVPSIDSGMLPAAVSPTVITDLLREDLGFTGLVITDALNMKGAEGHGAPAALKAGSDIIIAPGDTFGEINSVLEAIEEGSVSEEEIDSHVKRILFYKYLIGLDRWEPSGAVSQSAVGSVEADSISRRLKR